MLFPNLETQLRLKTYGSHRHNFLRYFCLMEIVGNTKTVRNNQMSVFSGYLFPVLIINEVYI